MRGRGIVIAIAVILGGLAGGAAVLSLARTPPTRELRLEGRTLREWTRLLGDESDPRRRESAWRVLPQFPAGEVAVVLVEQLDGRTTDTIDRAKAKLVRLNAAAVSALTAGVRDPSSPDRRARSIDALRRIGRPSAPAVDAIAGQIGDLVAGRAALEYFNQHGIPPAAVGAAVKSLEIGGSDRRAMVELLARFPGDERARAAILREARRPPDRSAQHAAFVALCAWPNPSAEEIDVIAASLDPRVSNNASFVLQQIGPPAAPVIRRQFEKHPNAPHRSLAAETLTTIVAPAAGAAKRPPLTAGEAKLVGEALLAFVDDEDEGVSASSARGLTTLWRRGDLSPLEMLRSPSRNARRAALDAIERYRLGATLDHVLPLTADPNGSVRRSAVAAVRTMWPAERDAEVLAFERESDVARRAKLVRLLPVCSDRSKATDALMAATRDPSPDVRQAAVETLTPSLHLTRVVDRLIELLRDESAAVRMATAGVLAKLRASPRVAAALSASGEGR